jgi:hypothetical protein
MEDVLEVYALPYDPTHPQVCLDEASKQILSEIREPVAMECGQVRRVDSEYHREGTCSLFMVFEPLGAKRRVFVRDRRTAVDYAQVIKILCDEMYPDAETIVLVQDNLNTPGPHSLYAAFAPSEARRLRERIEWHYTPKHGSWLNMAETELSVLATQCLEERMGSREHLEASVAAWESSRNAARSRVNWRFTTADARIKLKWLYPSILPQ